MPCTVLLVDDQPDFLLWAEEILAEHSELAVVGSATSASQSLTAVVELDPHVVVLDVLMPDMTGFEAARRLHGDHPDVRVVLVSAFDDPGYAAMARQVGAAGFIPKKSFSGCTLWNLVQPGPDHGITGGQGRGVCR